MIRAFLSEDAGESPRALSRAFQWDDGQGRYRDPDTGRFLSRSQVRGLLEESLRTSGLAADSLADLVASGTIDAASWRAAMREEVKREYIRQYLLGAGGQHKMTPSDWGKLGAMIREQYQYLNGFAAVVAEGEQSEAQIRARARMYTNSAREAYGSAHEQRAHEYGMDQEAWELGSTEHHCSTCPQRAGLGWVPIGTLGALPGDGSSECLSNCLCLIAYRRSSDGRVF